MLFLHYYYIIERINGTLIEKIIKKNLLRMFIHVQCIHCLSLLFYFDGSKCKNYTNFIYDVNADQQFFFKKKKISDMMHP